MRKAHRFAAAVFTGSAAAVLFSAAAWACIAGPTLDVTPRQATAGSEVAVKGVSYNRNPVVVRFNALDGPVLGTIEPTGGTGTSSNWNLEGRVTLPADARPGNYVLIATQPSTDGKLTQIPTRALVSITGATAPIVGEPLATEPVERPVGLVEADSVSTATKVLIGVGVAGVAMFMAGIAALVASRRPATAPTPVRVSE
ncbi:MAG: hypothetical protein M3203_02180 [Actinomycetota bacterium]|nr:hypothetical protein [Actinomycetota bacterium]